jgi:hypothetical protein
VTVTTPVPGQASIQEALAATCPQLSKDEQVHLLLALQGLPHRLLGDTLFRKVTSTQLNRNTHIAALQDIVRQLRPPAMRHFKSATLALDIGTVHRRYLAFVIVTNGRALFWRMIEDVAVGGSFTANVVKDATLAVITELAQLKVKVVACVADNAANLQAIANPVAEDDSEHDDPLLNSVRVQMPLMLRCGCHVLQLAVYDLQPLWQAAFDLAKTVVEAQKLRVSANETRWNSKYRVMEAAFAHIHTLPSTSQSEVSEAMVLLEPFARATDVLQSDSATLWDTLRVFESLNGWCATLASKCGTSPLGRARMEGLLRVRAVLERRARMIFNVAYLMIAYFAPNIDRTSSDAEEVSGIVKSAMTMVDSDVATEWVNFDKIVLDVHDGNVGREQYIKNLEPLRHLCPKMYHILVDTIAASPSEASVERLLSRLKYSYGSLQSRSSAETTCCTMQAVSLWNFFYPAVARDDDDGSGETPLKRGRTESSAAAESPNPARPDVTNIDDEEVVEEKDDFDLSPAIGDIFHLILAWHVPTRNEAPVPVRIAPRTLRSAADVCQECNKPCRTHDVAAYITCRTCDARRSVTHVPIIARGLSAEDKAKHQKVDSFWTCRVCSEK